MEPQSFIGRLRQALPFLRGAEARSEKEGVSTSRYKHLQVGFHGDQYLLRLVESLAYKVSSFIETGANVGTTLAYTARSFPHLQCLSCEPDVDAYKKAVEHTKNLPNVIIYNQMSQDFIRRIEREKSYLFQQEVLFWLDAHGYGFQWPLREEVAFITEKFKAAFILIDDFQVPGMDCFGYDEYNGQICSLEYIKDILSPEKEYTIRYPAYTEKTSPHHPLRGWILLEFGHGQRLELPESLSDKVRLGDEV